MNTRLDLRVLTSPHAAIWVAVLTLLAACSGGGGQSQSGPDPTVTDPDDASGAIEGGGRLAGVISEIDADGHVSVGKVRFTAGAAKVYVDGESASVASLRAGDVVSVTGTVDLETKTGRATAISADAVIVAAIDTVDPTADSLGTLTMLGQEIHIDENTVFGGDVQPPRLSSLLPGDIIRLSGLYKDVGVIAATRIDRAVGSYVVAGVVTQLDAQNQTFWVNDSILVDYADAGNDFPTGAPRDGDPVRVTGTAFDAGGPSDPDSVVLRPDFVWYNQFGTTFTVFPSDFTMMRGEMAQFTASSGPGSVTWSIVHGDGRACTPDACGVIDPTTGTYNASKFGNDTTFLVIATSIIDPTDRVAVPLYVSNSPSIATGPNTLEGDVFAFETGPVSGGAISLWVDTDDLLPFTWFNLFFDDQGHFAAPHLPDSLIHVTAVSGGHVQPCVVRTRVPRDDAVRVEMIPDPSLTTFDAPRPQLVLDPTLSGTVYEMTPSGRQPVSGASIGVHLFMWDNVVAYTMSDRGGGYFLCNLSPRSDIVVWKRGYSQKLLVQLDTSQSQILDIELERD
jgi:Domain of unknown function (DUF5666)